MKVGGTRISKGKFSCVTGPKNCSSWGRRSTPWLGVFQHFALPSPEVYEHNWGPYANVRHYVVILIGEQRTSITLLPRAKSVCGSYFLKLFLCHRLRTCEVENFKGYPGRHIVERLVIYATVLEANLCGGMDYCRWARGAGCDRCCEKTGALNGRPKRRSSNHMRWSIR